MEDRKREKVRARATRRRGSRQGGTKARRERERERDGDKEKVARGEGGIYATTVVVLDHGGVEELTRDRRREREGEGDRAGQRAAGGEGAPRERDSEGERDGVRRGEAWVNACAQGASRRGAGRRLRNQNSRTRVVASLGTVIPRAAQGPQGPRFSMKIEERAAEATPADSTVVESRVDRRDDAAATIVARVTVTNRDRRESSSSSVHVRLEDGRDTATLPTFDRSMLVVRRCCCLRSTSRSAERAESS